MQIPESIIKKESRKKKPYIWLILYILLFILSATSSYYLYTSSVKIEQEYITALGEAYIAISEKDTHIALLSSVVVYLSEEYTALYEAYNECCEPKTPI